MIILGLIILVYILYRTITKGTITGVDLIEFFSCIGVIQKKIEDRQIGSNLNRQEDIKVLEQDIPPE